MNLDLAQQARLTTAMCFVKARPEIFREGFGEWLEKNGHIWFEFELRADLLYRKGRRHFGAKAIWESIRFDTALKDTTEAELKLNNNWVASLARLWICHHSQRDGFFDLRHKEAA